MQTDMTKLIGAYRDLTISHPRMLNQTDEFVFLFCSKQYKLK